MNDLKQLKERIIGHIEHPQNLIMEYGPAATKRQLAATQKLIIEYFDRVDVEFKKKDDLYRTALNVIADNYEGGE